MIFPLTHTTPLSTRCKSKALPPQELTHGDSYPNVSQEINIIIGSSPTEALVCRLWPPIYFFFMFGKRRGRACCCWLMRGWVFVCGYASLCIVFSLHLPLPVSLTLFIIAVLTYSPLLLFLTISFSCDFFYRVSDFIRIPAWTISHCVPSRNQFCLFEHKRSS